MANKNVDYKALVEMMSSEEKNAALLDIINKKEEEIRIYNSNLNAKAKNSWSNFLDSYGWTSVICMIAFVLAMGYWAISRTYIASAQEYKYASIACSKGDAPGCIAGVVKAAKDGDDSSSKNFSAIYLSVTGKQLPLEPVVQLQSPMEGYTAIQSDSDCTILKKGNLEVSLYPSKIHATYTNQNKVSYVDIDEGGVEEALGTNKVDLYGNGQVQFDKSL